MERYNTFVWFYSLAEQPTYFLPVLDVAFRNILKD